MEIQHLLSDMSLQQKSRLSAPKLAALVTAVVDGQKQWALNLLFIWLNRCLRSSACWAHETDNTAALYLLTAMPYGIPVISETHLKTHVESNPSNYRLSVTCCEQCRLRYQPVPVCMCCTSQAYWSAWSKLGSRKQCLQCFSMPTIPIRVYWVCTNENDCNPLFCNR